MKKPCCDFQTALKMTTDSVLITDLSNQILDANDAALRMYGVEKKEELIGRDWFDFIPLTDKDMAIQGMQAVLMNGSLRGKELNLLPRSGEPSSGMKYRYRSSPTPAGLLWGWSSFRATLPNAERTRNSCVISAHTTL